MFIINHPINLDLYLYLAQFNMDILNKRIYNVIKIGKIIDFVIYYAEIKPILTFS